jgi:hypothetical protein
MDLDVVRIVERLGVAVFVLWWFMRRMERRHDAYVEGQASVKRHLHKLTIVLVAMAHHVGLRNSDRFVSLVSDDQAPAPTEDNRDSGG